MVKRRSKKNKSGSHGYGSSKKNRGAGNRGGRGNAGSGKKGQSKKMLKDGVQEMGEHGFNSRKEPQTGINLRDIDQRIDEFVEEGVAEETDSGYVFHAGEEFLQAMRRHDNVYVDLSIHHTAPGLAYMAKHVGPDKLLFASDYPYGMPQTAKILVEISEIFPEDKRKIAGANAEKLFFD